MTTMHLRMTIFVATTIAMSNQAIAADLLHIQLKDRLDRPDDGYCLDIPGTGSNLLLNVPLFAHNCKSGPTPDSAVTYTDDGQLVFPAAQVCVTAFGVNNTVYGILRHHKSTKI